MIQVSFAACNFTCGNDLACVGAFEVGRSDVGFNVGTLDSDGIRVGRVVGCGRESMSNAKNPQLLGIIHF